MTVDQADLMRMFDEGLWMPAEALIVLSDNNDDKAHVLFKWHDAGLFVSCTPDELREFAISLMDGAEKLEQQLARQSLVRQALN